MTNSFPGGLMIGGAGLALLGILGLAVPAFTTLETREVARIGDLRLQTTEGASHSVPPVLSGGVLVVGIILMGAGMIKKSS